MMKNAYNARVKLRNLQEASRRFLETMSVENCGTKKFAPKMLGFALERATNSPDVSTQVGALLATPSLDLVYGWNDKIPGMVVNLDDSDSKHKYILHAERSAIYKAVKSHLPVAGSIMFAPWSPCAQCAQTIVSSGVAALVVWETLITLTPERWKEEVAAGRKILEKSDTAFYSYSGPIESDVVIRFDAKELRVADTT